MIGKAKKVKAFTLIEILIASVIFAIVAVVATSSMSMIIAASNKTDDLTSSESCVRQVSDFTRGAIAGDHFGKRLKVVLGFGSRFKIYEYGQAVSENSSRFMGVAYFDSQNTFKIIYKKTDSYYVSSSYNYIDDSTFYTFSGSDSMIHSENCKFFASAPTGWSAIKDANGDDVYNFNMPFKVSRNKNIQALSATDLALSKNRVYLVNLRDVAYRANESGAVVRSQADANNSNIFSRLDLSISESEKSI